LQTIPIQIQGFHGFFPLSPNLPRIPLSPNLPRIPLSPNLPQLAPIQFHRLIPR